MIGIFDSGLGGLSVFRELRRQCQSDLLYLADSARMPYGEKSRTELQLCFEQALSFFAERGADAVIFACGTVSSAILSRLEKKRLPFPVFGVLEPSVKATRLCTKNRRVAVAATSASVECGAFDSALRKSGFCSVSLACPLFVPLIENGFTNRNDPLVREAVTRYLSPALLFGADTLLLGCTHYSLLSDAIADCFPGLSQIDCGKEAARALLETLPCRSGRKKSRFCTTGSPSLFAKKLNSILKTVPGTVERVSLSP